MAVFISSVSGVGYDQNKSENQFFESLLTSFVYQGVALPSLHDIYCGRLLLKRKIVSVEQIWTALKSLLAQHQRGHVVSLAEELRRNDVISDSHAEKLNSAVQRHRVVLQEKALASILLSQGKVNREKLAAIVQERQNSAFHKGLATFLLAHGILNDREIAELQGNLAAHYAQTVSESEAKFLHQLQHFGEAFNPHEQQKVLFTLGLATQHPAQVAAEKPTAQTVPPGETKQPQQSKRVEDPMAPPPAPEQVVDAALMDSSHEGDPAMFESGELDSSESNPLASVQDASARPGLKPEDCPIYGYEILAELGKGAMGVVYKARHIFTNRIAALKVLPLVLAKDSQYLERFKREAMACMKLQHENLVRSYDFGGSDEYYYLELEFVDGGTLEQVLEAQKFLEQRLAMHIIKGVANGLGFAWSVGVLHRDIKPENIMITKDGIPKLADFGIVKLLGMDSAVNVTMAGTTVGTPYYISPEQARGEDDLDVRSDIYSLGITAWHLLTGTVPFTGKSQGAILVRHILEPVPDPRTVKPDLSPEICAIVQKMVAKKREDRYQTPEELSQAIDQLPAALKYTG